MVPLSKYALGISKNITMFDVMNTLEELGEQVYIYTYICYYYYYYCCLLLLLLLLLLLFIIRIQKKRKKQSLYCIVVKSLTK